MFHVEQYISWLKPQKKYKNHLSMVYDLFRVGLGGSYGVS
jgi:hypothetical protein